MPNFIVTGYEYSVLSGYSELNCYYQIYLPDLPEKIELKGFGLLLRLVYSFIVLA